MIRRRPARVFVDCLTEGCGTVTLTAEEVQLLYCAETDLSTFTFRCPACKRLDTRPTPPGARGALLMHGAPERLWHLPALETASGPPITVDDVAQFQAGLDGTDWARELRR